ncbi:MAG: hypothetical protein ACJAT3_001046, partial [Akkermansiaceae bacterium]
FIGSVNQVEIPPGRRQTQREIAKVTESRDGEGIESHRFTG